MSFQGDISSLSLCDVFQNLHSNRKTGTLTVNSHGFESHVQFQEGNVISYTDNRGFSIDKLLTDKQVVAPDRMAEAMKRLRRAKRKSLGAFLSELGILDKDEYRKYVKYFVTENLYEVLSLQQGAFQFHEGDLSVERADGEVRRLDLQVSPPSLMMEAARRADDWEKIRRHMPSKAEIYWISQSEREHMAAQTDDEMMQAILPLLDGNMTLGQVIDNLPFSRFEACRCLASLISGGKLKPIDSSMAVELSNADDPAQAIAYLKTILEREPNNRAVLQKLATLHQKRELLEDSAKYNKLLAISYLEDGDLQTAKSFLSTSLKLNPKDMITWQKLRDCVYKGGRKDEIISFGRQYVEHFKDVGLMDVVREHLEELVKTFPDEPSLRTELADARFSLGDPKAATQELMSYGNRLLKDSNYDVAEGVFSHVLKYDHNNQRAKEICDQISTGRFAQRRAFRRRLIRTGVVWACLLLGIVVIGREILVHKELFKLTRTVFAESLLEERRYDEAILTIRELQERYPFSFMSAYEAQSLIDVLEAKKGVGK